MNNSLTESQKLATQPEISARVMANAGAGKTYVLTARVLRLLLSGVHPSKILCLTYTKAAAAEMNARISRQLEEWVLDDDKTLRAKLRELTENEPSDEQMHIARTLFSATLESAPPPRIQTIHSFCQDVLKRFPLESGIQPYFEVVDDITSRELINETKLRLLAKINIANEVGQAIDYIAAVSGEVKFNSIVSEIIGQRNRLRDMFENVNSPAELVEFVYAKNNIGQGDTAEELEQKFWQFAPERIANLQRLVEALRNSKNENDVARGDVLADAISEKDFENYRITFLTEKKEPRKTIITKDARKFFDAAEEIIAREQAALIELTDNINLIENLEFTGNVIYLAHGLLEAYDKIKQSRAVLDYNDLIFYTKRLLTSGSAAAWVLYKLDGGIEHILVDEAQDTSPEQWDIIMALVEEFTSGAGATEKNRTIFIVGDEKQSIYSFQGADLQAFADIAENMRARSIAAGKTFQDIELKTSYRSVEPVLKLVDETFKPEDLRKSIALSTKEISHILRRKGDAGRIELWPIIRAEEKERLEDWKLPMVPQSGKNADWLLAEKIADTIADWINSGRKLESQNRAVKPSDILILLKSRGEMADMLIKKLKSKRIPVSGSDRLKLTEHIAIKDLLALAQFLLLPQDDLNLACILKSPLFGISEDDLFELCYDREITLWHSLGQNAKFAKIHEELENLLNKTDFVSVYELFSLVLDQLGARKKFIARLGHEVNDVFDEFLDLAVNFERSHTNSLQQFVHWICISNMEIKRDMEQTRDEVRIMTVHGSKGLEAPIIFLADAAKVPTPKQQLFWDKGIFYSYKTKSVLGGRVKYAVRAAEDADYDEYLRLLYVAITRARDEIYITGSVGEQNRNIESTWYSLVENSLKNFAKKREDGSLVYQTAQENSVEFKPPVAAVEKIKLPQFANKKLPNEVVRVENLAVKETGNIELANIGKKIHKVLEVIGNIQPEQRERYLKAVFEAQPKIADNLQKLITEFPELFSAQAKAEVPIIGKVDGKIINARIDRLVMKENEILIVDFKTTETPPEFMPNAYKDQLVAYKKLIELQYPKHAVKAAILWTATAKLVVIA